jgi:hypothetical protein
MQFKQESAIGEMGFNRDLAQQQFWGSSCPLWVKTGHFRTFDLCPLFLQKRTIEARELDVRFVPHS